MQADCGWGTASWGDKDEASNGKQNGKTSAEEARKGQGKAQQKARASATAEASKEAPRELKQDTVQKTLVGTKKTNVYNLLDEPEDGHLKAGEDLSVKESL